MATHVVKSHRYPVCNKELNRMSNADENKNEPADGDFSVCIGCASPLEFKNGQLRELSVKELMDLPKSTFNQLSAIQDAILQVKKIEAETLAKHLKKRGI